MRLHNNAWMPFKPWAGAPRQSAQIPALQSVTAQASRILSNTCTCARCSITHAAQSDMLYALQRLMPSPPIDILICRHDAQAPAPWSVTLIRVEYARARLLAHDAQGCKGSDLVSKIKAALAVLQAALTAAKSTMRMAPLLYLGLVHFWRISAPLMRAGTWQHLQEPLTSLQSIAATLPGQEAWKAKITGALAQCLGEVRFPWHACIQDP